MFSSGRMMLDKIRIFALTADGATRETLTLVAANTNYPCVAPMPSWARYILLAGDEVTFVSLGSPTTATVGVPAGWWSLWPWAVQPTGDTVKDTLHFQSPTAGATVWVAYLREIAP